MADESTTVEEVQAPAEVAQAEAAPVDEASAFVDAVASSVEESPAEIALDEPVAEVVELPDVSEPVEPSVVLTDDEVLDRYPDLIRKRENVAAQKKESELRKESATREATMQRTARLKQKLLENPDDPLDGTGFLYENAGGHIAREILTAYMESSAKSDGLSDTQVAALRESMDVMDTSESIKKFAEHHVAAATENARLEGTYNKSIEDLLEAAPSDSLLAQSHAAHDKARITAAVKAAQLQARPTREPEPNVGVGGPVGPTGDNPLLLKLEQQGRSALSPEERAQAAVLLGVPLPD